MQADEQNTAAVWQDLICRLEGVFSAKAVFAEDDTPLEIHILASMEKSPKALTRDVQSALMAAFGVEVDYRIISIAQVHSEMSARDFRLCYLGMDNRYINGLGEITVYLSHGDSQVEGKSSYTMRNTASHLRGVALATLDAISKCVPQSDSIRFEMISSEIIDIGGRPANLVTLCDDRGQSFIGSSFVKEHHDDAVVRSVLDALNRKISRHAAGQ